MSASSPFLQYIAEDMHTRRYAKRTVETYLHWIKFFILFHKKRPPSDLQVEHVEQFLIHLCVAIFSGHTDVKTTQIYTHVLKQGASGVKSPLSQLL